MSAMPGEPPPLADAVLDALHVRLSPAEEDALRETLRSGRRAWPPFAITDEALAVLVASRLDASRVAESIAALDAAGVVLAAAAVAGDPAAIAALDQRLILPLAAEAARRYPATDEAELAQVVRKRLLVVEGVQRPKLASYGGQAPLGAWLRVVIVRTAVSMLRRIKPSEAIDESDEALADLLCDDLELAHMRTEFVKEFKLAFHEAVAALEERDRTLLRMHVLDGASIDDLGRLHDVHRATAARWLTAIRETLFQRTRVELLARLRLDARELEDLVGVFLSRLDVSLARVLTELGRDEIADHEGK
jgi:RNA polymerase sigma-70 factor (ECF subfamily)